ncbi:hypothetical protein M405DRAFT_821125, partial [Rhizopogon salebrosus TDB-379]
TLYPSSNAVSLLHVFQTDGKIYPTNTNSSSEDASYSSIFHVPHTRTIPLRVIHGYLILDSSLFPLISPPIRFDFPSPALPAPARAA